jgi:hypothetical protein
MTEQGIQHSRRQAEVRPSSEDRCAECGTPVEESWVSYRQKPDDPTRLIHHFGGTVLAGPAEPRAETPKPPTSRDFRYPDDVGVFFHTWCAPRVKLPEKLQEEITELLAQCLIAGYKKTLARWSPVSQAIPWQGEALKVHAYIASTQGRRVFTMERYAWTRFRAHEGKLIEIDLARLPIGGIPESASAIAGLAHNCHVHTERIEVWRYSEKDPPQPTNLNSYLVLQNLTPRRLNLAKFAEQAATEDSPKLRKYLREHVFVVKEHPDKGRWDPKAQALERIVFMSA